MQTHKILDRVELLFPLNSQVADLRRSFIDKDLHSIFRLMNDKNKEHLRKIILENINYVDEVIDFEDDEFINWLSLYN